MPEQGKCEWTQTMKRADVATYVKCGKSAQQKRQLSFGKIFEVVKNSTFYSFQMVDIHSQDHFKEKYKN